MKVTESLKEDVVLNLRNLTSRRNEILIKIGQLYVDSKLIENDLKTTKTNLDTVESSLNKYLESLRIMYPSGDIDLANGTITYDKSE